MAAAGRSLAQVFLRLRDGEVRPGVKTRDLDEKVEKWIRGMNCVPSFKGYHGYPASVCISINEEVVHGIPGDRVIEDGDIVGILPGIDRKEANPYLDIVLPTGLGCARNCVVAASHAVIIVGGGAGTLSEAALAWQMRRLLLAWRGADSGWSSRLADKPLDGRERFPGGVTDLVFGFDTAGEAVSLLQKYLKRHL